MMGTIEAMIAEPLSVRVCGAIRPSQGWKPGNVVRHFIASGVVVFDGRALWLSRRENQVLTALIADASRSQLNTMLAFVGEDDADGGPTDLLGTTQMTLWRLKEKLNGIGLDLVRDGHPRAPLALRRREACRVTKVA